MTVTGTEVPLVVLSTVVVVVLAAFAWPALVASVAAESRQVAGEAADVAEAEARRVEARAAERAAAEAAEAEARRLEEEAAAAEAAERAEARAARHRRALEGATTEARLAQIFQKRHDLGPIVQHVGNEPAVVEAILQALDGQAPAEGLYERVVLIGDHEVTVRGAVVDGIIRISTAFVGPSR